ncbi:MAG: OB-fold domain-containing protein [Gordonia sp. (in: high G+C Gram-positive bacteria)]|uniref:Zn-ribbon domain-containing OB-fold protein n=1 Tax=Gordonia sp. (in: high G+C Gram-positive bacteria) TaxID=84139 RepID=UPI003BB8148E
MTVSAAFPSPAVEVPVPNTEILEADLAISFDYTRSLGPVLSPFALALREGRILGGRTSDGRTLVPPVEFDPVTGKQTEELVEVGPTGTVTTWSWQAKPLAGQPLSQPFAWALIQLHGADSALLHVVKADGPEQIATGQRVHPVWKPVRTGRIDDIAYFVPGEAPFDGAQGTTSATAETTSATPETTSGTPGTDSGTPGTDSEPPGATSDNFVTITTPVALTIAHAATEEESWYLEGLRNGKLLGGRVATGEVYFPPRQASPADGSRTVARVELADTGTVTTFCIVNVPFLGQQIKPPYVAAYVLLDGADIPFLHLILDCPAEDVRMGMRVKAVWRPKDEWEHTLRNISHFAASGEPDALFDAYRDHL